MTVPDDLAAVVGVSALALSRDAARLAVATRRADLARDAYETRVHVFERNGTRFSERATPRLEGSLPAFSPSGELLALVERAPRGACRIVVHDLALRARHEVLEWPDVVEELAWSPSGRLLGFVARQAVTPPGVVLASRPGPPRVLRALQYRMDSVGFTADRPRHCFAVEPGEATGAPRCLSGTAFDDCGLVWLGDDDSWAFVSRRHEGRELDLVSDVFAGAPGPDGPQLRQLTRSDRLWGPLAYDAGAGGLYARYQLVSEFPCDEKLARLDPATGEVELLGLGVERSLAGGLVVSPAGESSRADGPAVFSLLADAGSVQLVCLAPRGTTDSTPVTTRRGEGGDEAATPAGGDEALQRLSGQGVVTAFDVAGGLAAFAGSVGGHPPVVQLLDLAAGSGARTIFEPNATVAQATRLLEATYVGATAEDGTHLDCWVQLPGEGSEVVGSALYVPGGGGQFGYDYSHDFQVLASAGIAVVFGNARGSGGYGESWMRTVCGPKSAFPGSGWGGVDRSDMLSMTAAVLDACPQLPRDRVGVLGGSYGGLMAALLGFTSDRFCAVVAERGPFDLAQMAATSDEGAWFFDAYIGAGPDSDPEQYALGSVMSYLDGVKQPVLIVHAEEDLRCPVQQAEALFSALRRRGADVTFVRFPGESHELSRSGSPVHRVQRIQIIRDWLVARLGGRMAAFELGT